MYKCGYRKHLSYMLPCMFATCWQIMTVRFWAPVVLQFFSVNVVVVKPREEKSVQVLSDS